jgi:hypothetical protein
MRIFSQADGHAAKLDKVLQRSLSRWELTGLSETAGTPRMARDAPAARDAHNAALARANQAPAFRHEECVHGVMYLALKQGVTVEYSPDNRVRTCTETK